MKRKIWKILIIVLVCLVIAPVPFFLLFFASDTYRDTAEFGDFTVAHGYYTGIHRLLGQDHAGVIEYRFDGEDASREITIPETYNGAKVDGLGVYLGRGVPLPFTVEYSGRSIYDELTEKSLTSHTASFNDLRESGESFDEVYYEDFVLHLGKQIRFIETNDVVTVFELKDGKTAAHCMRFTVICDEENEDFYSQDGVLYNKDGTVFDDFVYTQQELELRV